MLGAVKLEKDFAEEKIHPGDLKGAVTEAITKLTAPIREFYEQSTEWKEVTAVAYPDPSAKKDVKKKVREFSFDALSTLLILSLF